MSFNERNNDIISSLKIRAGRRRTYFIDIRKTERGEDYFITLTESTRRSDGRGYDRYKLHLYKEDFNRFIDGLDDAIHYIKKELMPDYDFEEFDRRQQEYEDRLARGEDMSQDYKPSKEEE